MTKEQEDGLRNVGMNDAEIQKADQLFTDMASFCNISVEDAIERLNPSRPTKKM